MALKERYKELKQRLQQEQDTNAFNLVLIEQLEAEKQMRNASSILNKHSLVRADSDVG